RLNRYVRERREAGAALGTIWNELKALKAAFHVALRAGRVARVPTFPTLEGADRVRTGFFEEADFRAVLAELEPPLQAVVTFAYFTGWRIPSEVQRLTWPQVDFAAGLVRLEVGSTKGAPGKRDGRTFPFAALPALAALIAPEQDLREGVAKLAELSSALDSSRGTTGAQSARRPSGKARTA